ncbi:amidohydrolase [Citricoccus sp.]|uniref:amidohydrolase n=1 Tax=Citricoccus sp. TaxID=1978372 RepID=UPI00262EC498|nr:amidohydrolase [Citricoccus sp.]HRO30703.1 amidohydrolase [Citricoccus sp.]
MTPRADLYIHGADLPTVLRAPGSGPAPDAVAVSQGRITAVGPSSEVGALVGPGTRVVDAAGGALIPGINDAHLHFTVLASILYGCVDVSAHRCPTWNEVAHALRQAASARPAVVKAHGWDEFRLGAAGVQMLAGLGVDVPVVAFDQTGHQLLANEALIRMAGVTSSTPDPPGGVIGRHPDGRPNGLFVDAAMELPLSAIPAPSTAELRRVQLKCQSLLHSWGITSLTEPGLGPGGSGLLDGSPTTGALESLAALAQSQELALRVNVLMLFAGTGGISSETVRSGLESDLPRLLEERAIDPQLLRIGGVKVFADGTPRSGTAWMSAPYGTECSHGQLVVAGASDEARITELKEIIALIHRAGLQSGVHATGDATTSAVVDAVAAAQEGGPSDRRPGATGDPRHYVIHGAFNGPDAPRELARMVAHGVGLCTNPLIRFGGGASLERLLGPERFAWHQPLASAARAGVRFTATSDAPVSSVDWRGEIIAMVTRMTRDHDLPVNPAERISSREALAAMTSTPAWQDHAETLKGTLAPGQFADLCLLESPWPSDHEIQDLSSNPVRSTWLGGRLVHGPA